MLIKQALKRLVLESIIFSVLIHAIILGIVLIRGYIISRSYIPTVVHHFDSVNVLDQTTVYTMYWNGFPYSALVSMLIGMIVYFVIRYLLMKK